MIDDGRLRGRRPAGARLARAARGALRAVLWLAAAAALGWAALNLGYLLGRWG